MHPYPRAYDQVSAPIESSPDPLALLFPAAEISTERTEAPPSPELVTKECTGCRRTLMAPIPLRRLTYNRQIIHSPRVSLAERSKALDSRELPLSLFQ